MSVSAPKEWCVEPHSEAECQFPMMCCIHGERSICHSCSARGAVVSNVETPLCTECIAAQKIISKAAQLTKQYREEAGEKANDFIRKEFGLKVNPFSEADL